MSDIKEQKWNEVQLDVSIKEMTPRHFKWKKGEKKEKKVFYCWRVFCGRLEMDCLIVVASCLPPAIPSHSLSLSAFKPDYFQLSVLWTNCHNWLHITRNNTSRLSPSLPISFSLSHSHTNSFQSFNCSVSYLLAFSSNSFCPSLFLFFLRNHKESLKNLTDSKLIHLYVNIQA